MQTCPERDMLCGLDTPGGVVSFMIPEKLGRYEIQAAVGEGAMGRVYRALDPVFHRFVAIKAIKGEILTQDDSGDYLRRFQREAQAVGALSHPAIVTIYDVGDAYFVMEYLEGTTLHALLQQRPRFPLRDVLPIVSPVADALDCAHRKGVIHRDIKPANIMVLPDGSPKIMDFGLAHLESTVLTTAGQFLGSPSYMSPEQVLGGKLTPAADIYSLAVVAYEMLTGNKPFAGSHVTTIVYKVVHDVPEPPRKWNRDLPEFYDDVFAQALAKDPKARFETASDFIAALNLQEIGDATLSLRLEEEELVPEVVTPPPSPPSEETTALRSQPTPQGGVQSITERKKGASPSALRRVATAVLVGMATLGLLASLFFLRGRGTPLTPLQVESDPAGATVTLDGVTLGATPVDFRSLAPGAHTLRLSKQGYASEELKFTAEEGVQPAPFRFALKKLEGTLSLRSDPEGASVKVDGTPVGTTPLLQHPLKPGGHQIVAELKDHRPWSIELESTAGENLNLVARLAPKTAARSEAPVPAPEVKTRPGDLVELGPGVTPPRKVSGESASYPPAARRIRQEGTVTVEMTVTEEGVPTELEVVQSAGHLLDEAVLKAVATWRYEPAQKQGVKVRVRMLLRQSFRLGN